MTANIVLTKDLTRFPRYRTLLIAGAVLQATITGNTALINVRRGDNVTALPGEWRAATPDDGQPAPLIETETETGDDQTGGPKDPADTTDPVDEDEDTPGEGTADLEDKSDEDDDI